MNHETDGAPHSAPAGTGDTESVSDIDVAENPQTVDAPQPPARGWGEWAIAAVLFGAGVVVLVDGLMQKASKSASGVGADFLPKIIGPLLMILAVILVIQLFRGKYGEPEQAEGDVDLSKTQWIPLVVTVAALMLFVYAVEPLGYIITATIVFWVIAWAMGSRKYFRSLAYGFILATVIYYVFTRLLSIHLPAGFLENIAFLEGII